MEDRIFSDPVIARVQSGAVDGRASNVRYRQTQLTRLYNYLSANAKLICETIIKDSHFSDADAQLEFSLASAQVKGHYDALDFGKSIIVEYAAVKGNDHAERRAGVGTVILRPATFTRFYSIISALAASLAAGNCVILELDELSYKIDALLIESLRAVLDRDTFGITTAHIDVKMMANSLLIDQSGSITESAQDVLSSAASSLSVAFVDRTADVKAAAIAVVTACFLFQGCSPYAPDIVFVNEFVKDRFVSECQREAFLQGRNLQLASKTSGAKSDILSGCLVIEVEHRNSAALQQKTIGHSFMMHQVSSLSDAVLTQHDKPVLLASYHFGDPFACKFLSQHIPSNITFINQIPVQILAGPAAPASHAANRTLRYTTPMLTRPRPEFVSRLDSPARDWTIPPLKPTGQGDGTSIGFFEQGIMIGTAFFVLPVLATVAYGMFRLSKWGFYHFVF